MEEMLFLLCMFYTLPISHVTLITSFHLKNEEMNAKKPSTSLLVHPLGEEQQNLYFCLLFLELSFLGAFSPVVTHSLPLTLKIKNNKLKVSPLSNLPL